MGPQGTLVLVLLCAYGAVSLIAPCGLCGDEIDITIIAQNFLKPPFFNYTVNVHGEPQSELIYFLQKAADIDEHLRFTITYFGPVLGYFVNSINNLEGDYAENTSWRVTDVDFNSHKLVPSCKGRQTVTDSIIKGSSILA
ncbi:uncharacterized protein LOC124289286 [Haliotis rubra]|uniref:uncharacterized protein LOC124289286 n=1 Tax=Haliotis rubra TaxID=36100 RepID=UPI001EE53734|nr:uncharacterized protein LOC124289286 [Haliotis rubra]